MIKKLKELWKYFGGKKTTIGMVVMLVGQGIQAFLPNLMTPEQISWIITTGAVIGGVGIFHKGMKSETIQKWEQNIETKLKGK